MHTALAAWEPLRPTAALELLDAKFADLHIRNYAVSLPAHVTALVTAHVSRLEEMKDSELADYVLQLVQVAHPKMAHAHPHMAP
eukprot:6252854-Prymnesium_polylepis.2